jgi:hypothetical protein
MSPTGRPTVYLDGPEDFLDHGAVVVLYDKTPKWIAKAWKYNREGKARLPGQKTIQLVRYIFRTFAEDTTFYLAHGLLHRASLLTDLPGEALKRNVQAQNTPSARASFAPRNPHLPQGSCGYHCG